MTKIVASLGSIYQMTAIDPASSAINVRKWVSKEIVII